MQESIDSPKILLLEDREDIRESTEIYISKKGYDVVSAKNAEEAIQRVQNSDFPFCSLVMDIRIENQAQDGLQATKAIQKDLVRPIPAIIYSAFRNESDYERRAKKYGLEIKAWVDKIDLKGLVRNVGELFEQMQHFSSQFSAVIDTFKANELKGIISLREFLSQNNSYDPLQLSFLLKRLGTNDPQTSRRLTSQVNFITFDLQYNNLLENNKSGFVAFSKGVFVGYNEDEKDLIRDVYARRKTTDIYIGRLHPELEDSPFGPPVVFRRSDGFLR